MPVTHHTIVGCSCGEVIAPCECGDLPDSAFDPHEIDVRDGACTRCATGIRPTVKTTKFGAEHAHDMDNVVDMDRKE